MTFRRAKTKRLRASNNQVETTGARSGRRPPVRRLANRMGDPVHGGMAYDPLEARRVLATPVLPDMFSWASQSAGYMYDYVVEGNLLRFTTALANKGAGNLELRGGATNSSAGTQQVWQRIYNDDGSYNDVLAGQFVYHPGHGHIHFDGYAAYHLRQKLVGGGVGDIVATGGKVSFCLIDIAKYNTSAGNSTYHSCGQIQGVTAGWSDVYNRSLPDQWINITGVPAGEYWLQVVIDPDNQLVESDETNNTTNIPVVIGGTAGSGGDRYETNNTFLTASNLGMTSKFAYGGLSIHNATDVDYFQFVAPVSDHTSVEIQFSHSLGNIDLYVYNSQQQLIVSSTSTTDNEEVEWEAVANQTYYVKVVSADADPNGYEMYIHGHSDLITEHVFSTQVPIAIPDSPGPAITSTLQGPNVIIKDLNLLLDNLEHTWLGDLRIDLKSPAGTTVTVIQNSAQGGFLGNEDNFYRTTIDDQAPTHLNNGTAPFHGSFKVSRTGLTNPLAVFNNQNALGTWTLTIRDYAGQDVGTLREWGIAFTGIDQNPGDRFELNDYFPQAGNLGMIGHIEEPGLSIHRTNDNDYFRFIAGLTTTASIDIRFSHQLGDLDFVVYNSLLQVVAVANSDDDNEHFDLDVIAGELYYLEVYGVDGGTNQYELEIDVATRIGESFALPTLTDQWQAISFPRPFSNPVVVVSPLTKNDTDPAGVRIRNVTATGFEVRISEWDYQNGSHQNEAGSAFVVEAGRHVLPDGTIIEAGQVGIANSQTWNQSFSAPFNNIPVFLSQVYTDANPSYVVARPVGIAQSRFSLTTQEQEAADGLHAMEQVGWIAIGTGVGGNGAKRFEAGLRKSQAFPIVFTQTFANIPMFFASPQSKFESDPITVRQIFLNRFTASIEFQEEQSFDPETVHMNERTGWFAIDAGPLFVESSGNRFFGRSGGGESLGGNLGNALLAPQTGTSVSGTRGLAVGDSDGGHSRLKMNQSNSGTAGRFDSGSQPTRTPDLSGSRTGMEHSRKFQSGVKMEQREVDRVFEGQLGLLDDLSSEIA